jgi:hypothetical protein
MVTVPGSPGGAGMASLGVGGSFTETGSMMPREYKANFNLC